MKANRIARSRGFSLVELMIAMTIGMVLISAVLYVFLSNRAGYRSTENLSRIQENVRTSFELMARDVREAGSMPCGRSVLIANVLNPNGNANWWMEDWINNTLFGYDGGATFPGAAVGTAQGNRVAGTSALVSISGSGTGANLTAHRPAVAQIDVTPAGQFAVGDLAVICDNNKAALFQVSSINNTTSIETLGHAYSAGQTPGNCSQYIAVPGPYNGACSATAGTNQTYGPSATPALAGLVVGVQSNAWYVGCNGRGGANNAADCTQDAGRSLYRIHLQNNAGVMAPVAEEIVDGVRDMQVTYLVAGQTAYTNAAGVSAAATGQSAAWNWNHVAAANIQITLSSLETGLSTTGGAANTTRITRTINTTVSLRNRQP